MDLNFTKLNHNKYVSISVCYNTNNQGSIPEDDKLAATHGEDDGSDDDNDNDNDNDDEIVAGPQVLAHVDLTTTVHE